MIRSFQQASEQASQTIIIADGCIRLLISSDGQHVVTLHVGIFLIHPSKRQVTPVPQVGKDVCDKLYKTAGTISSNSMLAI